MVEDNVAVQTPYRRGDMDMRESDNHILLVTLPAEPQLRPELALVRQKLARMEGKDLIVDFSRVEIITSASIGDLMLLQKMVSTWGGRLILCGMRLITKCILHTVGLDVCFEFAEDRSRAMNTLHEFRQAPVEASRADRKGPV
jgi:anti-anti-sigma regulatory factor